VRILTRAECRDVQRYWQWTESDEARVAAMVGRIAPAPFSERVESASKQRLRAVIGQLQHRRPDSWTLGALANAAALSPSRFAHAFKAETGMAVRPYLRWMRLAHALSAAGDGHSLTDAAHEAGFADAAHFSRTMRRHFGIAPGQVLAALQSRNGPG
jgi:AraC-like DNA-binding protein